ncbi:NAD(P)H-binding protein [[Mycobacterium] zoologicum]|uniref:NAD(P)H-binding protein n=1 Tax=[Mycobacterium] zoologicum TaxID=2872311 RepID=UPI0038B5E455
MGADATSQGAVRNALRGVDTVASTLGTAYSRQPISLYSQSATVIIAAMAEHDIERLIVTSSAVIRL